MAEAESGDIEVRYTVKGLLGRMDEKLDRIEQALATKADKALVEVLAQRIETVKSMVPAELVKEHTQLLMQAERSVQHGAWVDKQLEEQQERVEKQFADQRTAGDQTKLFKRWVIGLVVSTVVGLTYTSYAIVHGLVHASS